METMETKDLIPTTEAITDTVETVSTGKNGLKTVAEAGAIGAVCIVAWELAVKPLARKLKDAVAGKKAKRKLKNAKATDVDLEDMELDDIPDID